MLIEQIYDNVIPSDFGSINQKWTGLNVVCSFFFDIHFGSDFKSTLRWQIKMLTFVIYAKNDEIVLRCKQKAQTRTHTHINTK